MLERDIRPYMSRYPFDDEVDPTGPDQEEVEKYNLREKVVRGFGLAGGEGSILFRRLETEPDRTGAGVGMRCVANHPEPITAEK